MPSIPFLFKNASAYITSLHSTTHTHTHFCCHHHPHQRVMQLMCSFPNGAKSSSSSSSSWVGVSSTGCFERSRNAHLFHTMLYAKYIECECVCVCVRRTVVGVIKQCIQIHVQLHTEYIRKCDGGTSHHDDRTELS